MSQAPYKMSFTTGGLFLREALLLAELFDQLGDWKAVRTEAVAQNTLQLRTQQTRERICAEVVSRLRQLEPGELQYLRSAPPDDQGCLLWLAACRRYAFIADFATEVLREHTLTLVPTLTPADFDAFFNRKCEWHPELDRLKPSTRSILRRCLFAMLRQAGLLTSDYLIQPVWLSAPLLAAIPPARRCDVAYLPVADTSLTQMAR